MSYLAELALWGKLYMEGRITLNTYLAAQSAIRAAILADRS